MSNNIPGLAYRNARFNVIVGINCSNDNSRIKFVISGGFLFDNSSAITTQSVLGSAPVILYSQILSPNVIVTTFN
jgi:hypothetical protein